MLLTSTFRLTIACEADRWTLSVSGDLDLAREADLAQVAEVLAARQVPHVSIDLGHVTFIDSAGYRAVERAAAVLGAAGTRVRVVNPSRAVARLTAVLEAAGEQVTPGSAPLPVHVPVPRPLAGRRRRPGGARLAVLTNPEPGHPPVGSSRSVA